MYILISMILRWTFFGITIWKRVPIIQLFTIAWNKIYRTRCERGLGLEKLKLSVKLFWQNNWKILIQVVKAKYFLNNEDLYGSKTRLSSTIWKNIPCHRYHIKKGLIWIIGGGKYKILARSWMEVLYSFIKLILIWSTLSM